MACFCVDRGVGDDGARLEERGPEGREADLAHRGTSRDRHHV